MTTILKAQPKWLSIPHRLFHLDLFLFWESPAGFPGLLRHWLSTNLYQRHMHLSHHFRHIPKCNRVSFILLQLLVIHLHGSPNTTQHTTLKWIWLMKYLHTLNGIAGANIPKWKWKWSRSVVSTLCNPMDCRLSGSSVHGIFQARVLEWIAISFSRGSSQPRNRTQVPRIAGRRFTIWATREAPSYVNSWSVFISILYCFGE